jgi:hypothetical protein
MLISQSISVHNFLSTGRHVVDVYNKPKVKFLHSFDDSEHCISHAQNMTVLQIVLFLKGIHRSLITNKGRSSFHRNERLPRSTANSSDNISTCRRIWPKLIFKCRGHVVLTGVSCGNYC